MMDGFRAVTDPDECQGAWKRAVPAEMVSDLWEVRDCFQRHFRRPAHFIVAEDGPTNGEVRGFLPLSWIEEVHCYGYFPGETWHGKTWLEQNRIVAADEDTLAELLGNCPGDYHLRYLIPRDYGDSDHQAVDEVGYLFLPPQYDYDMENYFQEFSHKSAKRIRRELDAFSASGVSYRHDELSDFDWLVELNVGRFGKDSYFYDLRFREGFRSLMHFLHDKGWLRLTALLIGGETAAVDIGCVYRGTYTLLAGGTHDGHPGVAKLINVHHMTRACQERFEAVDFLCGAFSWKQLFHLKPRPLYLLSSVPAEVSLPEPVEARSAACV